MSYIYLKYNDFYDNWVTDVTTYLRDNNIVFNTDTPIKICDSVKYSVRAFLIKLGYVPKDTVYYRVNLIQRLHNQGIDLIIQSNDLLLKYLSYFTDLDDYDKCFDIYLIVIDKHKASRSSLLTKCNGDYILTQPIHTDSTAQINKQLDVIKNKYDVTFDDIIDILYKINNKED